MISAARSRAFSTLVVAEQFNGAFGNHRNVVTAAKAIGKPIDILVSGEDTEAQAQDAASLDGVNKVFVAKSPSLQNPSASTMA